MTQRFWQVLTVTVIALLVWLYAEGATRRVRDVTIKVEFVPVEGQEIMAARTLIVDAQVRCATSQIDDLNQLALDAVQIKVPAVAGQPTQQVNLLERLRGHDRIAPLGVTIDRLEPEFAEVRAEPLVQVPMPIELTTPANLELAGPAVFAQAQAMVAMPASRAAEVQAAAHSLRAVLSPAAAVAVVPGVQQQLELPVSLPPDMAAWQFVRVGLQKVAVTFTVKKKEDEYVLRIVPVYLSVRPKDLEQYVIKVDDEFQELKEVKIKGPNDAIERIREQSGQPVEAILRLTTEDLENMRDTKFPELRLPSGVTIDSTLPLIKMTITRREAASPM